MKLKLSATQEEIVNHLNGALLVKAGPGSGKTRVLIERIKKLLLTKKRCKVLALTFSNLAAEEMKNRLQEDSSIDDLVDNVTVGTIHSFCLDIVQTRGNLIGLGTDLVLFEDSMDRQKVLKDIFNRDIELSKILKSQEKPDRFLTKCLEFIAEQKKKFVSPEIYHENESLKKIYENYNQYLIEQNAIDFDDILFYAYKILSGNPKVMKLYTSLYKFICVDEAQDLNFAQYQVLKALCGSEFQNIMLVGDENQSIYGFNGSDSKLMTESFVIDFKPTIYELNENFRSAKAIVEYANRLEKSDSIPNYYYEGELKLFCLENEQKEAEYITDTIKQLINNGHKDIEGELTFDDFAVIARNKYVLNEVEKTFIKKNIPCYFKKTASGIDSESNYIKIFELSMRLLINPRDVIHLRELYNHLNKDIPEKIVYDTGIDLIKAVLCDEIYKCIVQALILMDKDRFEFGKGIKKISEYIERCEKFDDDEKYLILSDVELWKKHWQKYIRQVQSEQRSLISFRNYISLGKTQDVSADKGVALLTAHMSKGLQYEVVFVIGLTEGTFPDYRAVKSNGKEMEQEKNNMFVAVTRAKRLCYLTYPKIKQMPWGDFKIQQKSRFLNGLDMEEIRLDFEV